MFRRNIAALSNRWTDPGGFDHQHQCGRNLDALALHPGRPSGTKAVNLALMRLVQPTRTAAAVITAKNEGCYLLECVAHNRAVGFDIDQSWRLSRSRRWVAWTGNAAFR